MTIKLHFLVESEIKRMLVCSILFYKLVNKMAHKITNKICQGLEPYRKEPFLELFKIIRTGNGLILNI